MSKSIAIIICVNDDTYFEECLFYIDRLRLPEGYVAEVYPVRQAESIYQGYNLAMHESDAEYKVYMHQDVFLVEPDMLLRFVELFEGNSNVGIAGVLGADAFSENRRFYRSWNLGNVLGCSEKKAFHNYLSEGAARASALDGMFLMTGRDIPWREDVLSGWDFYDISQSLEFAKEDCELWVLAGKQPWCIHDCGYLSLAGYDEAQKAFLEIYQGDLPDYTGQPPVYPETYREHLGLMMELKEQWKALLFLDREKDVRKVLGQVWDERFVDTEMVILKNILEILQAEEQQKIPEGRRFLDGCGSFDQVRHKYLRTKFYLRRLKYAPDDVGVCPEISEAAEQIIRRHTML